MKETINKFIDIQWQIPNHQRDDYYVSIECLKKDKDGKNYKYDCCLQTNAGCNIAVCNCKPEDGLKIRLYDKGTNLIDEKVLPNRSFTTIIISRNDDDMLKINVKNESSTITNIA
ncbi:MAG TPA: hypothetical protein VLG50_02900 [Candidatus Saccharimonadales bacterium]|nr:hypothetical protein [Candidatus Saccharimonadales bacterium]